MSKAGIEEQLAFYRALRRKNDDRKARKKRIWDKILYITSFGLITGSEDSVANSCASPVSTENEQVSSENTQVPNTNVERGLRRRPVPTKDSSSSVSVNDSQDFNQPSFIDKFTTLDWTILGLKFVMWLLLCKVAILLEFGAVFFIFSAFIFIWLNMRSEPKKEGEISAYSVFNPNCEVINGTFTAEQFERELLHKM